MRHISLTLVLLACVLLAPSPADAGHPAMAVPDRLMLKPARAVDKAEIDGLLARLSDAARVPLSLDRPSVLGWYRVRLGSFQPLETPELLELAAELRRDPMVAAAQPDWYRWPASVPSDPFWDEQWGSASIDMPGAWDHTAGSSSVVVAIVDTGMIDHEDLSSAIVGGYDFIADSWAANDGGGRDSDWTDAGDGADCGDGWADSSWHGTAAAGVAAARANNGKGIAGTAYGASLLAVRVLGRCGGALSDIIEGSWWAAGGEIDGVPDNAHPASVLNLSLGGPPACSEYEEDVYSSLEGYGIVTVVAAGNEGADTAEMSPISCSGVIGVAAHDHQDYLSSFSNYGDEVDLIAPGGDQSYYGYPEAGIIVTVGPGSDGYAWYDGTSFSTPFVSGAVALVRSMRPSWDPADVLDVLAANGRTIQCWDGENWAPCDRPGLDAGAALDSIGGGDDDDAGDDDAGDDDAGDDDAGDDDGGDDDPWEDNDEPGDAVEIGCPESFDATALDDDWFRFAVDEGTHIEARIEWSGDADLDLYLTDTSADVLASSEEVDTQSEHLVLSSAASGTYGLLVRPYEGTADYALELDCDEGGEGGDDDDGGGGGAGWTACALARSTGASIPGLLVAGLAGVAARRRRLG